MVGTQKTPKQAPNERNSRIVSCDPAVKNPGETLLNCNGRVDWRNIPVQIRHQETDQVIAVRQVFLLPLEWLASEGQDISLGGRNLADSPLRVQVHPLVSDGEGVAPVRSDLRGSAGVAVANKSHHLEQVLVLKQQLRPAGFAGFAEGVDAVHRVNRLFC